MGCTRSARSGRSPLNASSFALAFDWVGRGSPGSQPYELFDADFNLTGSGLTAPVPEPASASLLMLALSALALLLRRRRARLA